MHPVSSDAHTIGVWRECVHGDAMAYRATLEGAGYRAVRTIVDAAAADGFLTDPVTLGDNDPWWGTLDIYDANHSLIDGFHIPSRTAWQWWHHAAELQLDSTDCDICNA